MNQNVELPYPKSIYIRKLALDLHEYDYLRKYGEEA